MRRILTAFAFCFIPLAAFASQNQFNLAAGEYLLVAKYKFEGQQTLIEQSDRIVLSYDNSEIRIVMVEQPDYLLVAKCSENQFKAHMDDAAGAVNFEGTLVADSHVIGQMKGDGPKQGKLSGSFELKPATE